MTDGNDESETADESQHSERVLALVLELDAALHEGRSVDLPSDRLSELTPDEQHQLEQARQQLQFLYNEAPLRRAEVPRRDRLSLTTTPHDASLIGISDELQKFLGIEGTHFGRFEILRELGVGGHGMVFLARDPVLGRLVALKVPKPDVLINPSLRRRFLAEGRAAGILTHPNIVTVFESNEVGTICYLAQDYIPGPTLARWFEDHPGPVAPRVAALFFLQLAEAVSFAHSKQILHRDITPANILLAPPMNVQADLSLDKFAPKLTDFGMAKMKEIAAEEMTRTGAIVGTPAYMSPEQADGRTDLVYEASDVYSLGAVLYELLTDVRASKGKKSAGTLHRESHDRLTPPRQLIRGFPRDLDAICMKCLRSEPADRYQTAQALADDLRRFCEGRPVLVRPQPVLVTLAKWGRRNPIVSMLSTLVACSIFTMLVGSLWYNSLLQRALEIARVHEQNLLVRTDTLRRRVYADDMRQAADAWQDGNLLALRERLRDCIPKPGEADLRTFPWWVLSGQIENASQVIGSFAVGDVAAPLVIDSDQHIVYCGESDGIVRARSLPAGKLLYELRDPTGKAIHALHLARFGKTTRIVSGAEDGIVQIWDLANRRLVHTLPAHPKIATAVRFLGNECEAIASGGDDGVIRIWNGNTGKLITELSGHTDVVRSFDEQSRLGILFSSSQDETIRAWDWRNGRADDRLDAGQLSCPRDSSWARAIALSPDGKFLAAGFRGGRFIEWNVTNESPEFGKVVADDEFTSGIRALAWTNDLTVAVGLADSHMFVRRTKRIESTETIPLLGHTDWVMSLAVDGDEGAIVTSSKDGTIRHWPANQVHGQFPNHSEKYDDVSPVSWSGNILTVCQNGEVSGYEMPEGRLRFRFSIPHIPSSSWSATLPDGRRFFVAEQRGDQYFFLAFDCRTGEQIWQVPMGNEFPMKGALSNNGSTLLLAVNREVWGLNVENGDLRFSSPHPSAVNDLQCVPHTMSFVSVCMDGKIRFWDVTTGALRQTRAGHQNSAQWLAISANGARMATSGEDLFVRVWDLPGGEQIATFSVGTELDGVFLVDEGRTLVTRGGSQLRFWNVAEQIETGRWKTAGFGSFIRISADRKTLISHSSSGVRLLNGPP